MKKFKVYMERVVSERVEVLVDANDAVEAKKFAFQKVRREDVSKETSYEPEPWGCDGVQEQP